MRLEKNSSRRKWSNQKRPKSEWIGEGLKHFRKRSGFGMEVLTAPIKLVFHPYILG